MRRPSLLALALLGCSPATESARPTSPAPPAVASAPPSTPAPSASPRYAAVFDELVRRVERDHVFPPAYVRDVGHPWSHDVPRLRDEFARATGRQEALQAVRHLQNSLRDPHCSLRPPADLHSFGLRLGVRLWTGGTAAAPDVRVTEVLDPERKDDVSPGDALVSVDGVPLAAWIAAHPFESNELSPAAALEETVSHTIREQSPFTRIAEGDTRVLGLRRGAAVREVRMAFRRTFPAAEEPSLDDPPPMARVECDPTEPARYGDYVLSAMGVNVCVYVPVHPARPRVPIVRYVSFMYPSIDGAQSLRMVKVDHDVLAAALRGADGVVLDVHDNGGGNNPFVFLGWFSGGPWDHERVVTRVVPGLDAAAVADLFWDDEDHVAAYLEAQRAGRPTLETRFLCRKGRCTGDAPDPAERVTRAPVALVVGPGCASSCDTIAVTWSSFHLGPLVGRQPMHAYTVSRLPVHVTGPESEDLGTVRLAVSQSEFQPGRSIEGEPLALDWEAPPTFDSRETWVRDAVREAVRRVSTRR